MSNYGFRVFNGDQEAAMGIEFLAGGIAVVGIAVVMGCHDALRGMRMKRAMISTGRITK